MNYKYFTDTNYKDMSLSAFSDSKEFYDQILVCGYLRFGIETDAFIESITNLICKWYHRRLDIQEFNLKKLLGRGNFGRVQLAQHTQTKREYAIKILDKRRIIEMKQQRHVQNEKKILNQIAHPFIISLLYYFEDNASIYFIFELLEQGCEFFDLLRIYDRLNVIQCAFYAAQIVLIFEYLHSKHIIFRDLKPENLMYSSDGYLKLIDFGFAKQVSPNTDYLTQTVCGTPEYMAPECVLGCGHSFETDWWSLGILIFEMFVGFTPFEHENVMQIYANIIQHNGENEEQILKYLEGNGGLKDFVSKLLRRNPKKRLGKDSKDGKVDDIIF